MRLSQFIQENMEQIVNEWENFAQTIPVARNVDRLVLRDHITEILQFIITDMEAYQNSLQWNEKLKIYEPRENGPHADSPGKTHAEMRSAIGFDMVELAAEYRALRASIIKLWTEQWEEVDPAAIFDLIRFNESIDQLLMESICRFKEKVLDSRKIFIDVLDHDLHNLVGTIEVSSNFLLEKGALNKEQILLASKIRTDIKIIRKTIFDLISLIQINIGTGISITTDAMDIGSVGRQATAEVQAIHPNRIIVFEATGNIEGIWDRAHISQVFTNLTENAILQSFNDSPVTVKVTALPPEEIVISFQYKGEPIPKDTLSTIFNNLSNIEGEENEAANLALGLYIAKEIVIAHGGKINVASQKEDTTFTVRLPRAYKQDKSLLAAA
jgi:signal transduction histidine kinase